MRDYLIDKYTNKLSYCNLMLNRYTKYRNSKRIDMLQLEIKEIECILKLLRQQEAIAE